MGALDTNDKVLVYQMNQFFWLDPKSFDVPFRA
jgi:hypothetical protein